MMNDYNYYIKILRSGEIEKLEELCIIDDSFPDGVDSLVERRWIINAIDCGSIRSIKWILDKKVNIVFRNEEGYTVLHSALERNSLDKYEVIELLIKAGADINLKGPNDWTPSHAAAAKNDVLALKIFVKYGADLTIRTAIDDYATPLEEARMLNEFGDCSDAITFLELFE